MGIRSKREGERRVKARFRIRRELRYKLLEDNTIVESGIGETIDMASGGVAIQIDHPLRAGTIIELAISWPVLLQDACPMAVGGGEKGYQNGGEVVPCQGSSSE